MYRYYKQPTNKQHNIVVVVVVVAAIVSGTASCYMLFCVEETPTPAPPRWASCLARQGKRWQAPDMRPADESSDEARPSAI